MPITFPLEVYKLIFDYFSVQEYDQLRPTCSQGFLKANLMPSLLYEARSALDALSLTCKPFNEFARAISLKDSFISSSKDFTELCHMAKRCRVFPIETLSIMVPESSKKRIQDITSTEFLTIMNQCVRLRGLRMSPPLLISSRLPHALKSLAQCATLTNLRSLQLFLQDSPNEVRRPNPKDLAQVLLLMPSLTVLQIRLPDPFDQHPLYDTHDPSELPPPPFQLEYLVISEDYLNLEWLTSTSHNHLKVAHFTRFPFLGRFLNLEHPWPKLLYLNLHFLLHTDIVTETLHSCPNIAFLTLGHGMLPIDQDKEEDLIDHFGALQRPLTGLTLAFLEHPSGLEGDETEFAVLATTIETHPNLSELKTLTIEIQEGANHQKFETCISSLRHACEAKGIRFALVCSYPCDDCEVPGYVIPLPDEL